MKKSEIYRVAQMAIVDSHKIDVEDKLEILRELFEKENTAKYWETKEAEEAETKEVEGDENESA